MQQGTAIAVGPALARVRNQRGLTLDEAARDTRIRREFLEALEAGEFDRLLGDVHVRGCLRTYASYLRLSPDRVVAAYAGEDPRSIPTPVPKAATTEHALGRPRRRDNHRLAGMIAAMVLVLAAAFGVLSARNSAPAPAEIDAAADAAMATDLAPGRPIAVGVLARQEVVVTVTIDAAPERTYRLLPGEGRGFEAKDSLTIRLSDGGAAELTVAGREYGAPGVAGEPWENTYSYGSPSPAP